ncbi:hypothetical protein BG005_005923, partial [Podila minutissima]
MSGVYKFVATMITADEFLKRPGKDDETKPWPYNRKLRYFEARFSGVILIDPLAPDAKMADNAWHQTPNSRT